MLPLLPVVVLLIFDLVLLFLHSPVVNYEEFVAWFKFRTGDEDPTLPVLPEYIVSKIKALGPPIAAEKV